MLSRIARGDLAVGQRKRLLWLLLLIGALALAISLSGCSGKSSQASSDSGGVDLATRYPEIKLVDPNLPSKPLEGEKAPELTFTSNDAEFLNRLIGSSDQLGKPMKVTDIPSKVVLLNFWASWCGPCREEMPAIQAAYNKYSRSDFTVIEINVEEGPDKVQGFVDDLELRLPVARDSSGKVTQAYRVFGLPNSYFVNKDGIILARFVGAMSKEYIDSQIRKGLQAAAK